MSGEMSGAILGVGAVGVALAALPIIVGGAAIVGVVRGAAAIATELHEARVNRASNRADAAGSELSRFVQDSNIRFREVLEGAHSTYSRNLSALGESIRNGEEYIVCRNAMMKGRRDFVNSVISESNALEELIETELVQKLSAYEQTTKERCSAIHENLERYKAEKEKYGNEMRLCAEELIRYTQEHIENMKLMFEENGICPDVIRKAESILQKARQEAADGHYEAAVANMEYAITDTEEYLRRNVKETSRKRMYHTMYRSVTEEIMGMLEAKQKVYYVEEMDDSVSVEFPADEFARITEEVTKKSAEVLSRSADEFTLTELEGLFWDMNHIYEQVMQLCLDAETAAMNEFSLRNYAEVIRDVMEEREFSLEDSTADRSGQDFTFSNEEGDEVRIVLMPDEDTEQGLRTNLVILSEEADLTDDVEEKRKELRMAIKEEMERRCSGAKVSLGCSGKRKRNASTRVEKVSVTDPVTGKVYEQKKEQEKVKVYS